MQYRIGRENNLSPLAMANKNNEDIVGLQVKGSRKEQSVPKQRPFQPAPVETTKLTSKIEV